MKKKPTTKKGGSGKTSTKKNKPVFEDNQTILQTSSVRKKDLKALKKLGIKKIGIQVGKKGFRLRIKIASDTKLPLTLL